MLTRSWDFFFFSPPRCYRKRETLKKHVLFFLRVRLFIFHFFPTRIWEFKGKGLIDRLEMWRENKTTKKKQGFGVWGFIILAGTIKEVCTRLMLLYLTKTEREEKGKSLCCREQQRFLVFCQVCFSPLRLEKMETRRKMPIRGS